MLHFRMLLLDGNRPEARHLGKAGQVQILLRA
jgi:hypothetical protein